MFANKFGKLLLHIDFLCKPVILSGKLKPADILTELEMVTLELFVGWYEGQCIVASDVYKAVGYSRRAGVQAIQRLVPRKYRMWLGDVEIDLQGTPSQTQFC